MVYIIKDYRVRSVVTTVLLGQFQLNSGDNYRTLRTTVTVVTTTKHRLSSKISPVVPELQILKKFLILSKGVPSPWRILPGC